MNSDLALQDSAVTPTKSPISVASVNNRQGNRRETLYDNFYTDDHTSPAKLNVNRFKSSSAISTVRLYAYPVSINSSLIASFRFASKYSAS